jgi:Undecaprenyl-phosphate galactose phosphotransferase WbaP
MLGQSAMAPGIAAEAVQEASVTSSTVAAERVSDRNKHRVSDPKLVHASRRANSRVKRWFDIFGAVSGLIFLAPIFLTIAIMIKLDDGGPIFFGHRRVGRRGRGFDCWKFRTMVQDADAALAHLLETDPEAAKEWRDTQKLQNDPRITSVGKFLRFTSLDELPQLFNVLIGEMSLVGPRPVTKVELNERYAKDRRYYLLVRPGVTGLWQVSGRNRLSYTRRVQLDEQYLREWSFSGDVSILVRTVDVVFRRDGAC